MVWYENLKTQHQNIKVNHENAIDSVQRNKGNSVLVYIVYPSQILF